MPFIKYLLLSNICLIVFFVIYRLVFHRENNFIQLRIFLLGSIILSLLLPFNTINIDVGFDLNQKFQANKNVIPSQILPTLSPKPVDEIISEKGKIIESKVHIAFYIILKWIYILVGLFIATRLILEITKLFSLYLLSSKEKSQHLLVAHNKKINSSFSFFNIIFINKDLLNEDDYLKITSHEKIHAQQYHTIDLILIELLLAVMWFNPIVWLMRSEIKLVHEYLADEGVLSSGIDRLGYQALLLNQVAEEKLICLSSSFNHSLKKRIIMMTKSKFNHKTKLKILALVPVTLMLFLGIACINGKDNPQEKMAPKIDKQTPKEENIISEYNVKEIKNDSIVTITSPLGLDMFYVGIDNPINISAIDVPVDKISPMITNASIRKISDGEFVVKPKRPYISLVSVYAEIDGERKYLGTVRFKVKDLPLPQAEIAGKSGGRISKDILLNQKQLQAKLNNFKVDVNFKITEFKIRVISKDGQLIDVKSNSNMFTDDQIAIIKNVPIGKRINIEEIKCQGPDGVIKNIPSIVFELI
jgi:beta-lactamase regulating signal transducer with metallopeptidase domain